MYKDYLKLLEIGALTSLNPIDAGDNVMKIPNDTDDYSIN